MNALSEHILEGDGDGAASLDHERPLGPGGEAVAVEGDGVVSSRRRGEREHALRVPQVGRFKGHLNDCFCSRGCDGPVYVEVCVTNLRRRGRRRRRKRRRGRKRRRRRRRKRRRKKRRRRWRRWRRWRRRYNII